jgi:hypothetical protein
MTSIEFAQAWTRKLESLGIVMGSGKAEYICPPCQAGRHEECSNHSSVTELQPKSTQPPLHPHPRRGRKRVYQSAAKKQRAYRDRSKSRVLRNRLATIDS